MFFFIIFLVFFFFKQKTAYEMRISDWSSDVCSSDLFEVCRRLKSAPATEHIPIVMVTALDQPKDRVQGLEAGADDFLTKPVNDLALFARVKSLVRLKMVTDELRMREATGQRIGALVGTSTERMLMTEPGRALIIDDRPTSLKQIGRATV